jgi:predicted oxidoreductase
MSKTTNYSRVIAGTMTWGSWGKQLSKKGMIALMDHCIELGITTFDHADIYGNYENETAFGEAFAQSGIKRENIQLISKCGIQMAQSGDNAVKHYQYDSNYIVWSAEQSLRKLQTEYLDLFLLHRPSPLIIADEVAEAVGKLRAAGKIKQFGVSNFSPSQIALLEQSVSVEGNQVEYSLTHDDPTLDGTFDDCTINNRLAMAWSPLGSYFREENERQRRISKVLSQLCDKYGADEIQLLLAFILKHPAKVYPVVGTTKRERLAASIKALKLNLELQDWFILLEAAKGNEVP